MSAEPIPLTVPLSRGMTDDEHRDEQIRVLLVHARHQAAQIAEVTIGQTEILRTMRDVAGKLDKHVETSAEWRGKVEGQLTENTEATKVVKDAVTAGKVATNVVKWVGGIAAALAGVWMFVSALGKGQISP